MTKHVKLMLYNMVSLNGSTQMTSIIEVIKPFSLTHGELLHETSARMLCKFIINYKVITDLSDTFL